jgi:hypothetical protein
MKHHQQKTLEAVFAHPVQHGVRVSRVEALFRALGAEVTPEGDRRLHVRLPAGQETWIHIASALGSPDLDAEALIRVRHFLQEAGITPDHPEVEPESARGDQAHRLVIHLDHHRTDVYRLEGKQGEQVEHAVLLPHGVWGSGQNLTHRHDLDVAGQRAPRDAAYLAAITAAMEQADAVLLLGHGTGESDMRQVLLHYLESHRRDLVDRIVAIEGVDDTAMTEPALLALAREHFGNLPHRRPIVSPGLEVTPA